MTTEQLSPTLNRALEDYYHRREGRYSPATWRAHVEQLERFRRWVTARTAPYVLLDDIDDRIVTDYFRTLRARRKPISPSTHNSYRQIVKMFFQFCVRESWIRIDPTRHIDPMARRRRVRLQLTPQEMMQALRNANPRDRIALAVGINTALRAQDVMSLKVGDAALDVNYLSVWIEKTNTEDRLPITADLRDELIRWFKHYAQAMGVDDWTKLPNEWTLIPPMHSYSHNPHDAAGPRGVQYRADGRIRHPEVIIQRALKGLGHETKGEGFHTLRRSAARLVHDLAAADADVHTPAIRVAQALLGHKNQSTTEGYLGITVEKQARDDLLRGKSFLHRAVTTAGSTEPVEAVTTNETRKLA